GVGGFCVCSRECFDSAIDLLREAIRIDPGYMTAKGLLALIYVSQYSQGWFNPDDKPYALRLAREVLARAQDDPLALSGAGHAIAGLGKEYELSLNALER